MVQNQKSILRLYESDASKSTQRRALRSGEIPVAVSGLGKKGLSLSTAFGGVTQNITGVDIDPVVDNNVPARESQINNASPVGRVASSTVSAGNFRAETESRAVLDNAWIHVLTGPTLNGNRKKPTLSLRQAAIDKTSSGLSTGDMAVGESTVRVRFDETSGLERFDGHGQFEKSVPLHPTDTPGNDSQMNSSVEYRAAT